MSQSEHALDRARRIFAIIKDAAERGEPCPTNANLAERVGCKSMSSTSDSISFLETAGMIRVVRTRSTRIVTISATGKSTAAKARWKDRSNSSAARMNKFADCLSEDMTVKAAAHAVGITESCAHIYLKRIKAGLGWQAQ